VRRKGDWDSSCSVYLYSYFSGKRKGGKSEVRSGKGEKEKGKGEGKRNEVFRSHRFLNKLKRGNCLKRRGGKEERGRGREGYYFSFHYFP